MNPPFTVDRFFDEASIIRATKEPVEKCRLHLHIHVYAHCSFLPFEHLNNRLIISRQEGLQPYRRQSSNRAFQGRRSGRRRRRQGFSIPTSGKADGCRDGTPAKVHRWGSRMLMGFKACKEMRELCQHRLTTKTEGRGEEVSKSTACAVSWSFITAFSPGSPWLQNRDTLARFGFL